MKLVEALLGEHAVIYALLEKIEQKQSDWTPAETTLAVVMLASALESHAAVEEDLLFRALEHHLGRGSGPLEVMASEHEQIEGLFARLGLASPDEVAGLVTKLVTITKDHFRKEEAVLFKMAGELLGEELQHELGRQWALRRGVDATAVAS